MLILCFLRFAHCSIFITLRLVHFVSALLSASTAAALLYADAVKQCRNNSDKQRCVERFPMLVEAFPPMLAPYADVRRHFYNPPNDWHSCISTIPADHNSRRETTFLQSASLVRAFFFVYAAQFLRCQKTFLLNTAAQNMHTLSVLKVRPKGATTDHLETLVNCPHCGQLWMGGASVKTPALYPALNKICQ